MAYIIFVSGLSYEKLDHSAIQRELASAPEWHLHDGALTRNYEFESYPAGVLFACAVAHLAESLNHHPDIVIGYRKVQVSMVTHDADGGLTRFDFELARRISALDHTH